MSQRIFKNKGVYKTIDTNYMWAIQNDNGDFYTHFKQVNNDFYLSFTDEIRSACMWESKKELTAWKKKHVFYCKKHVLKPIKVTVIKTQEITI